MLLSKISEIFFLQWAIGSAFVILYLKSEHLGKGFYILNTVIALVASLLAILFQFTMADPQRAIILPELFGVALFLFVAAITQARGYRFWNVFAFGAFVSGALALTAEVNMLAPHVLEALLLDNILRIAPFFLGSFLLGASIVGMNLGHWYLVSKGLPFELFAHGVRFLIGLVIVRAVLMAATIALFYILPGTGRGALELLLSADGSLIFFLMRLLWGILGPFILGVLALRCVQIKSNTSATGLMYVVVVLMLVGELLASYVTVLTAVPV